MSRLRVRTLRWDEVIAFYEDLASSLGSDIEPMVQLVRALSIEPYRSALFPCTSHAVLRMARVPDYVAGDCELTIEYYSKASEFRFGYTQSPVEKNFMSSSGPAWFVSCPAAQWERVLRRLLHDRLRWFHAGDLPQSVSAQDLPAASQPLQGS
jgi:hypothetical protein